MTKEFVKKQAIASWPEDDIYFSKGISVLTRFLSSLNPAWTICSSTSIIIHWLLFFAHFRN